jgi:outer membrane protein assembly factor BamA
MSRRTLSFGPLFLILGLLCLAPIQAQVSPIPDGCKPDPHRKVIIERIDFDGRIHLPDSDVVQVIADVNHHELYADNPDWLKNVTDDYLTFAWQNQGYMKVKVTAKAALLDADSTAEHFLVTAQVDEGLQYHLGEIQFVVTPPMTLPESDMRAAFPLHEGDLYDADIVQEGIEKLSTMYGVNADPRTQTNDQLQRVSLSIVFSQKGPVLPPLHVGTVQVKGLDPNLESRLMSIYRPGDLYNRALVDAFIKENQSQLPPFFYLRSQPDFLSGTIDLSFEFRGPRPSRAVVCPAGTR